MDARFIDEERADNTARSLLPIHYFAKRRGAKASGSFLQHGHCSEIFVWFNERAWVDRSRSVRFHGGDFASHLRNR